MNLSIFDVIGPIMVGPSSSHTAGAVKLARTAAEIVQKPFSRVTFGLHGSFAKTGVGHGTDKALIAGVLGLMQDDERIRDAFELAKAQGLSYEFYPIEIEDAHENTCKLTFYHDDGTQSVIIGGSIGGGRIVITEIDGTQTELAAESPTVLIRHEDRHGVISNITNVLAQEDINIGIMRVAREEKGDVVTTTIETDDTIPEHTAKRIERLPHVLEIKLI